MGFELWIYAYFNGQRYGLGWVTLWCCDKKVRKFAFTPSYLSGGCIILGIDCWVPTLKREVSNPLVCPSLELNDLNILCCKKCILQLCCMGQTSKVPHACYLTAKTLVETRGPWSKHALAQVQVIISPCKCKLFRCMLSNLKWVIVLCHFVLFIFFCLCVS